MNQIVPLLMAALRAALAGDGCDAHYVRPLVDEVCAELSRLTPSDRIAALSREPQLTWVTDLRLTPPTIDRLNAVNAALRGAKVRSC